MHVMNIRLDLYIDRFNYKIKQLFIFVIIIIMIRPHNMDLVLAIDVKP